MDGKEFKSSCVGTIACVCVTTQRANGLGLIGLLCGRRWCTCSVGRLETTCDACPSWAKEETRCQHLAILLATPRRRVETPLVDLWDSGTTRLSGQVGELAAELGVGCSEEGNPPPSVGARRKKVPRP